MAEAQKVLADQRQAHMQEQQLELEEKIRALMAKMDTMPAPPR